MKFSRNKNSTSAAVDAFKANAVTWASEDRDRVAAMLGDLADQAGAMNYAMFAAGRPDMAHEIGRFDSGEVGFSKRWVCEFGKYCLRAGVDCDRQKTRAAVAKLERELGQ